MVQQSEWILMIYGVFSGCVSVNLTARNCCSQQLQHNRSITCLRNKWNTQSIGLIQQTKPHTWRFFVLCVGRLIKNMFVNSLSWHDTLLWPMIVVNSSHLIDMQRLRQPVWMQLSHKGDKETNLITGFNPKQFKSFSKNIWNHEWKSNKEVLFSKNNSWVELI